MLFCWGDGSYGQLGLGEEGVSQPVPLRRIPPAVGVQEVVLVACGERHTLLLLADGSLASCGDNAQGQLGKTLSAGRRRCYLPEPIQALEAQMSIYISCGKEHSLAISNQGRVFSWGAGGFGQLGTGILENSLIPKKIDSLSMYNVIQIACGQYHSIALTKDGRVFSWGQNIHGQLGLGKGLPSQATPCNISSLAGIPVAQVAAGGAHSFVLSHSGVVYGWGRNNAHQLGLNQRTSKEQIFKPYSIGALRNLEVTYVSCGNEHTAVLTKSGCVFTFGDDSAGQLGHNSSKTGPQKIDEIDGPVSQVSCGKEIEEIFSSPPCLTASFLKTRSAMSMDYYIPVDLQETREVLKELTVRDWIARQISYSLLDHLVPALPRSSSHQEALVVFLLVPECCVALGAHMIPSLPFQFAEAVTGLSKCSSKILEKYWSLLPGPFLEQIVQMLKTWVSARLPYYNHSPQAKSWIHPLKVLKRLYKINMKATCRLQTSAFCIDEIPQKIKIEEDFWRWKLQVLKMKACNELVYNRALGTSDLPELPAFPLRVRRQFLVEDTWHKLSIMEDIYLKKHLLPSVEKNKYYLFGILCGLSIANGVTAYIPFPLALFKKLLNKKPTLSDLQELSPVIGGCLQTALDYEGDDFEDMFQLCYSISWDGMDVDLIENGILTTVNNANKKDFVNKYVDYIFNKSVDDVFSEFRRGFYKVLDEQLVGIFEPEQLIKVAIGNANYNWDLYEENAVYCDIYNSTHPTIKMFWEVFHGLSLEDKKRFLVFVEGNDRIPVTGMSPLKICPHYLPSEDLIPGAWICYSILFLPIYSTKQKLEEKLLQALNNNHSFGRF
ncbi:hypothetical protein Chor_001162 [Crotalus horridus]